MYVGAGQKPVWNNYSECKRRSEHHIANIKRDRSRKAEYIKLRIMVLFSIYIFESTMYNGKQCNLSSNKDIQINSHNTKNYCRNTISLKPTNSQ
jgi:hypothetical protein